MPGAGQRPRHTETDPPKTTGAGQRLRHTEDYVDEKHVIPLRGIVTSVL